MKDYNSGHDFAECDCGHNGCGICYGKIRICTKCMGCNKSLTAVCCGYSLTNEKRDLIAKGKLNYYFGKWQNE